MVIVRSVGFLGYLRLQVREHTIIESHPDNENPDLRLDKPWPALKEYLDQIDVEKLDAKERSHVPALVILYYFLNKFRKTHGGKCSILFCFCCLIIFCVVLGAQPKTRAEKNELRSLIENSFNSKGGELLEENFVQAVKFINTSIGPASVPSNVQAILDDSKCRNLTEEVVLN